MELICGGEEGGCASNRTGRASLRGRGRKGKDEKKIIDNQH